MNKNELLNSLSNKKRGNGETIDLNSLLSLNKNNKKKRETKKHKVPPKEIEKEVVIVKEKVEKSTFKLEEIDIDKLQFKYLNELIEIGQSLGITSNGIRKHNLIEKIRVIVQLKRDSIEKAIKKESISPFNKTSFSQLIIPEGQDGINELLFWKIFKNKTIYKKIMSFMNIYPNDIPYEYIISVEDILNNDQINLLKDKVNRNQYLIFKNRDYSGKFNDGPEVWLKLFKTIKEENNDNVTFYQNLFKYYKNQIPQSTSSNFEIQPIYISYLLIVSDCLIGLKNHLSMVSNLQQSINKQCVWSAFTNNSINCLKLLLDMTTSTKNVTINDSIFTVELTIGDFMSLCIYNSFEPPRYDFSNLSKHIKTMGIFIGTFKPRSIDFTRTLFRIDIFNCRLKDLINIIGLLGNNVGGYDNDEQLLIGKIIGNEIKSFKFSKQQLKSNLNDPINYCSIEKENIKKLLVIYFIAGSKHKHSRNLIEYYICYGNDKVDHGDSNKLLQDPFKYIHLDSNFEYAFKHSHYSTIKNWINFEYNQCSPSIRSQIDCTRVFKEIDISPPKLSTYFINSSKEEIFQFLNSLIQDIKSNVIVGFPTWLLFIILVNYNDLELVKILVSELGKQTIITQSRLKFLEIIGYIKSIEVMDYLFNEFIELFGSSTDQFNEVPYYFKNLNLIVHFEKLYLKFGFTHKISVNITGSIQSSVYPVSVLQHILKKENSSMYTLGSHNSYIIKNKPLDFDNNQENQKIYFSILKDVIKSSPNGLVLDPFVFYSNSLFVKNQISSKLFVNYLKWLYKFQEKHITNPIQKYFNSSKLILTQYLISNKINVDDEFFNKLLNSSENNIIACNDIIMVMNFIIKRGEINTLTAILNRLLDGINLKNQLSIKSFILNHILKVVIKEEQFSILEFLYLNYKQLFEKKISSNTNIEKDSALFIQNELRELVFVSLDNLKIRITEFLLSIITITKNQFHSNVCSSTYHYFKNGFK